MKSIFKKIIPSSLRNALRGMQDSIDRSLLWSCSRSRLTSSIYYMLFNRSFGREHQSVLQGRIQYRASLENIENSCVLLRRNIHRLEKGLIMRPRRPVFGKAFIGETVDTYALAIQQQALSSDEQQWCTHVLQQYFDVVAEDVVVDQAKAKFNDIAIPQCTQAESAKKVPYLRKDLTTSDIDFEQLAVLFNQRRSVRWYEDKEIDLSAIEKAVNIATQAPSACNRQPFKLHVVTNKEKVLKVAECAMGTAGFAHNLPAIIAVVGDLSAYPFERDRHVIYIDGSLFTMQLMLALETLGLSTCPINWPDIEDREKMLDAELRLSKHERTIMLLSVGYADPEGGIPYSQKKDSSILMKVID